MNTDKCLPSVNPPNGLRPSQVPQFVSIGFDDNGYTGKVPTSTPSPNGLEWGCKTFASRNNPTGAGNAATFDGARCRASYYYTTGYLTGIYIGDDPELVKKAWHDTTRNFGNEAGVHTHSHPHGHDMSVEDWLAEIDKCEELLTLPLPSSCADLSGAGLDKKEFAGFRAPYLHYNDNAFTAMSRRGFVYDCSIEEGWQDGTDADGFLWPYTLDEGSPGNAAQSSKLDNVRIVGKHSGLWEVPVHVVVVPPDEDCEQYGVPLGLRSSIAKRNPEINPTDGKITGLDWNCFVDCRMTKAEFLATLKYTLDKRYNGNRAPMAFGAHCDAYTDAYKFPPCISGRERQEAIEEFLDYALAKPDVRVVALEDIVKWMKKPSGLDRK